MLWNIPPRVKVLEALSTIADGRIRAEKNFARVKSSNLEKEYIVRYFPDKRRIYSTDNASKFHHYIGYPIIAFLMIKGLLSFNERIASCLKGINWNSLNKKFKRNYKLSEEYALKKCEEKGIKREEVGSFIEKVLSELKELKLEY